MAITQLTTSNTVLEQMNKINEVIDKTGTVSDSIIYLTGEELDITGDLTPAVATTNTATIQSALDSLTNGGTVYLPIGNIAINGPLTLSGDVPKRLSGIELGSIWFDNAGTRLLPITDADVIRVTAANCSLTDILINSINVNAAGTSNHITVGYGSQTVPIGWNSDDNPATSVQANYFNIKNVISYKAPNNALLFKDGQGIGVDNFLVGWSFGDSIFMPGSYMDNSHGMFTRVHIIFAGGWAIHGGADTVGEGYTSGNHVFDGCKLFSNIGGGLRTFGFSWSSSGLFLENHIEQHASVPLQLEASGGAHNFTIIGDDIDTKNLVDNGIGNRVQHSLQGFGQITDHLLAKTIEVAAGGLEGGGKIYHSGEREVTIEGTRTGTWNFLFKVMSGGADTAGLFVEGEIEATAVKGTQIATSGEVTTATAIDKIITPSVLSSISHNILATKQGGTTNEYYHLTVAEHTSITGSGSTSGQVLTSTGPSSSPTMQDAPSSTGSVIFLALNYI